MKTTEKGILYIDTGKDNRTVVIFQPVNGTVWKNRNELCELFGVYIDKIDTCLNRVFEANMFHLEKTCKFHRIVKGSNICYDIMEVSLKVIIAISFYIESTNAGILRDWFIERFLRTENNSFPILNIENGYCLN